MRSVLPWRVVLPSLAGLLSCAAAAAAAPQITCETPTLDLGDKEAGDLVPVTFVLHNKGDAPATIADVRASWSGGGGKLPTADATVLPKGGTVTITGILPITGQPGQFSRGISVTFTDRALRPLNLTAKATIRWPITVTPQPIDFGTVNVKDARPLEVLLIAPPNAPEKKFTLSGVALNSVAPTQPAPGGPTVMSPTLPIDVRIEPQPDGLTTKVVLTPRRDGPGQKLNGRVTFRTDNKAFPTLQVPLAGTLVSDVSADALGVTVIRALDGAGRADDVHLARRDGQPLKITGVDSPAKEVRVDVAPGGSASETLLKLGPIPKTVDLNDKFLVVHTDAPGMKNLRLPIADAGGRTAALDWGPPAEGLQMSLQTRTVVAGRAVTATLYVRNTTDQVLRLPSPVETSLALDATDAQQKPVTSTAETRPAPATIKSFTPLTPGSTLSFNITLTRTLALKSPGAYTVTATLPVPLARNPGRGPMTESTTLESNAARLVLTPPAAAVPAGPPPRDPGLP